MKRSTSTFSSKRVELFGSTCDWGKVVVWEPRPVSSSLGTSAADWKYDPALGTENELRFVVEDENRTRVELEDRRLDRYGVRRDEMRASFDKGGDWGRLLVRFAAVAAGARSTS